MICFSLPERWVEITFRVWFQKNSYEFEITKNKVIVVTEGPEEKSIQVEMKGKTHQDRVKVKSRSYSHRGILGKNSLIRHSKRNGFS
ncbi:MAG: glycosyl hydrolase family 65 protein [Desulfobacterales bacterium]